MDTAEPLPVAAIAAEPLEFRGLLRHASVVRRLAWPLAWTREAHIGGRRWILAAHGPGPRLARLAAEIALDRCHGRAITLSTGFCGALDPSLQLGDIFVAREVIAAAAGSRFTAQAPAAPDAFRQGVLWSQDHVAVGADEKRALRSRGADAVDMEAAAVAGEAARRGVPFYCVRAVSDTASESLPLDFNRLRDSEGRFSKSRITSAVVVHPSSLIPLLRFGAACRRAAARLGDFLACCF